MRRTIATIVTASIGLPMWIGPARAQSGTDAGAPSAMSPSDVGAPAASAAAPTASVEPAEEPTASKTSPASDPARKTDVTPKPALPPPPGSNGKVRFQADPIGDGATLSLSVGFDVLSDIILSTGELRPQQIDPNFKTSSLLGIDRGAISQHIDSSARSLSNVGLYSAIVFAAVDPILSGYRDGPQAGLTDAIIYAEAISFTWGITNLAKVALRRPRPIAYIERNEYLERGGDPLAYNNSTTDSSLSFFSGHASITASIAAASSYLAFSRSPGTARPWLTLVIGAALTAFVSFERVRAGAHFPSDVIAGAMAGAGVGLLVVHLHREDSVKQRPVWIGFTPHGTSGGVAGLNGIF